MRSRAVACLRDANAGHLHGACSTLGFKGSDMDLCLLLPMDAPSVQAAKVPMDVPEAGGALEDPESHDGEPGGGPKVGGATMT